MGTRLNSEDFNWDDKSMRNRRGFTIPEVLIAATILGALAAMCLAVYVSGARAWTKVDSKTELMSTLQISQDRIAREVRATLLPSVSLMPDNTGVAFLSAGPEENRQVDMGGRILWQEFVFYYHNTGDDKLYRKTEPYAVGDQSLLTTLETYSTAALATHKPGAQPVGRNLTAFNVTLDAPDLLRVVIRAQVKAESFELESCYQINDLP